MSVDENDLILTSVLSGNSKFEARIHPQVKMDFLMSPMFVVAFAIAGRIDIDLTTEPLTHERKGKEVYLKDIWPTDEEIKSLMKTVLTPQDFKKTYDEIFEGNEIWKNLELPQDIHYAWEDDSARTKHIHVLTEVSVQP